MEETIFDCLPEADQIEGNELFDEFSSNWDMRNMTPEEIFKIGFARGRGVIVPMNPIK